MTSPRLHRCAWAGALWAGAALLSGCASVRPDAGFSTVRALSAERGVPIPQSTGVRSSPADAVPANSPSVHGPVHRRALELLQGEQDLGPDAVVELALLLHPGLKARYAQLGLAEADRVQAGLPANPGLRFGRLGTGAQTEWDRMVVLDLGRLLTLPWARRLEEGRMEQLQLQLAHDTLAVAAQARRAFVEAAAARAHLEQIRRTLEATDASREWAQRMRSAGNSSALAAMREQAFHTEAQAQSIRAEQAAMSSFERLTRSLGMQDEAMRKALQRKLPTELPPLPPQPTIDADALMAQALSQRLDLQWSRRAWEQSRRSLELVQGSRWVSAAEVAARSQSASGEPVREGYEVALELPLWDGGAVRVARAQALQEQAGHRLQAQLAMAQSEVREAVSAQRSAWALAQHQSQNLVPLRQRILQEQLLRYNGMLGSVFELLADAREVAAASAQAVQAQRDYWLATIDLQMALTAGASPAAPALLGSGGVGAVGSVNAAGAPTAAPAAHGTAPAGGPPGH